MEWGMRVEREGVEPGRKLRIYDDFESALGRFRFIPEQPGVHPEVLKHLGTYGLKQVPEGWTWKFDPGLLIIWKWAKTSTTTDGLALQNRIDAWRTKRRRRSALWRPHAASKWRHAARDYGAGYLPSPNVRPAYRRSFAMKFLLLEWHRQNSNP